MSLSAGTRLGSYEVIAPLGAGGMGEVYRARDLRLNREVAIKVLPPSFASDADRVMRFEREAKTLASLNHPHIAQIFGIEEVRGGEGPGAGAPGARGVRDGVAFSRGIVMELVEGETLADRIARGPLPLDEAFAIARQIAEALEAAHDSGIIHRDLKPANVKIRADGTVKVLDFGLAKAPAPVSSQVGARRGAPTPEPTMSSPAVTHAGMILGTAAYMSPEQARGKPVDQRADLWAFGCVLYEMLTGRQPFGGETVSDSIAAILGREVSFEPMPPNTPASIRRLLRRCLARDPRARLHHMADARLDLEDALDPARAEVTSTAPPRGRFAPYLGLVLGAVLVAIAGGYLLGSRAVTDRATPAAVTRFIISAPAGTQIVSGHREVVISADGQQIAFIARGASDQHIYVRRVDELTARQIAGTDGARDLTFSPDGRWLAFNGGNKIRKVSLGGGAPTVLADAVHSHGIAWHAAEDAIYFAPHQRSAIWKVPASGDSSAVAVTTLVAERGELSHEWPLFSADGQTLVFSVNANADLEHAAVAFLNLPTSAVQTIRTGGETFALTDRGELMFVRSGAPMGARYSDNRLSSSELLDPAAAIDGSVVALSSNGTLAYVPSPDIKRRSLVWISPDGRESDAGFGRRGFGGVSLSPDGRRVAIAIGDGSDDAIYLADASGGTLTMLTKPAAWAAAWSPDGESLAGVVRPPNTTNDTLVRVAAEPGRTWETLFVSESDEAIVAQWTPDARALLFSLRDARTGRRSVATLGLDSTPPKVSVIVNSAENRIVQLPSLSDDGRWLAYESDESGRAEVYVQGYPSPTARFQVSRDGGSRPMWTKRGDAIYFVAGNAIMSSAVTTDPEPRFGIPRVIVSDPLLFVGGAGNKWFDVAPDGRILAIKEDSSIPTDHIVVVQNWLGEVRARQAEGRK